jgi:hypothetical protein
LQKKQIDRQSERIAVGKTLRTIYGQGAPLDVGEILQAETLSDEILGISEARKLRDGRAECRHVAIVEEETGALRQRLKHTSILHG